MGKCNKLISYFLIMSMAFSILNFMLIASAEEESAQEVQNAEEIQSEKEIQIDYSQYDETAQLLLKLNLITEEKYNAQEAVTRLDFVKLLVNCMNIDNYESYGSAKTVFADMPMDEEDSAAISVAYSMGIIKGNGEGVFGNDQNIDYNAAIKMAVCSLGFGEIADLSGSYPIGYISIAQQEGLLSGFVPAKNNEITYKEITSLVFNMLHADVMETTGYGVNKTFNRGETFLKKRFNIEMIEDVVTSCQYTNLYNANYPKARKDEMQIGDYIIKLSEYDGYELIGKKIKAYCKMDDDNINNVLLFVSHNTKNETIKIDFEDLGAATSNDSIVYYTDVAGKNKTNEAVLKSNASILYNGRYIGNADNSFVKIYADEIVLNGTEHIRLKEGFCEVIDNNNDGDYEVVKFTNYKTVIVDKVLAGTNSIKDMVTNSTIDLSERRDLASVIVMDGKEIPLTDLKQWNVLSIISSIPDNTLEVMHIDACANTVAGEINEIKTKTLTIYKDDINNKKTTVSDIVIINQDDEELQLSTSYLYSTIEAFGIDVAGKRLNPGDNGTFYLDSFGKIAAFRTSSQVKKYAYLIKAGLTKGFDPTLELLVSTEAGKFSVHTSAQKLDFNFNRQETERTTAEKVYEWLTTTSDGKIKPQLIAYMEDDEGKIVRLEVAHATTEFGERRPTDILTMGPLFEDQSSAVIYNVVNGLYKITPNTKIYYVPKPGSGLDIEDKELYSRRIQFDNAVSYNIDGYNIDNYNNIGIIVISYTKTELISPKNCKAPMLVAGMKRGIDPDTDSEGTIIYGYQEGYAAQYFLVNEDILTQETYQDYSSPYEPNGDGETIKQIYGNKKVVDVIKPGDVVYMKANSSNKITDVFMLHSTTLIDWNEENFPFRASSLTDYASNSFLRNDNFRTYSTVEMVLGKNIYFKTNIRPYLHMINGDNVCTVYIYNSVSRDNPITVATMDDITEGDKIFYMSQVGQNQIIVIYR